MFLKDGKILVDDFRHQNFAIWIILGQDIAIFAKKLGILLAYKAIG